MTGGLQWQEAMIGRFVLILDTDHSSTLIMGSEHNFSEIARVHNGGFL